MTKQELEVALQAAVAAWNSDKPGLTLQGELEARGLRIVPAEPVAWIDTTGVYAMTKKVRDLLVKSGAKRKTDLDYSVQCYADPEN